MRTIKIGALAAVAAVIAGMLVTAAPASESQRRGINVTRACFGIQHGNPPSRFDVNIRGRFGRLCIVGRRGPRGPAGRRGLIGRQGETGATGAQGIAGPAGPQGPAGTGTPGPQGPAGPAGPKGDVGATGPAGPQGATGAQGPKGDKGNPGGLGDGVRWLCFNGNPGGGVNDGGTGAAPDCAGGAKVAYKVVTLGVALELK